MKPNASYILSVLLIIMDSFALTASERCQVRILSQEGGNFVIEVTVDQFTVTNDENGSQLVSIDGLPYNNEAGKPHLPIKGVLLSVPAFSQFAVVILEEEFEIKTGIDILPNPTPEFKDENDGTFEQTSVVKKDVEVYGLNDFYPVSPVAQNILGFMRDQYLLKIRISPAQYNPVQRMLRLNKRIRFQIKQRQPLQPDPALIKIAYHRNESSIVFDRIISDQILNSRRVNTDILPLKFKQDTQGRFDAVSFYKRIAGQDPAKISISRDGLYKLDSHALSNAGLDLSFVNPQNIHLLNRGREMPIYVAGEDDGKFDSDDFIIFYGQANNTIYSNDNIYWLTVDGQRGRRMGTKDGQPANSAIKVDRHETVEHVEDNKLYEPFRRSNEDQWIWDEIKPGEKKTYYFHLSEVDTSELPALITVLLYGRDNREYSYKFFLNGKEFADTTWFHGGNFVLRRAIPQPYLAERANVLVIESFSQDDVIIYLDWFEIASWKTMTTEEGKIEFAIAQSGNFQFEINGFTDALIDVYEIQDTTTIFRIINSKINQDDERYTLHFDVASKPDSRFICLESNKYLAPKQISIDEPSDLHSTNRRSDYIIIAHESLYNSILPLAELHKNEGLSVEVVKVQDVYDEFSYGIFHPEAIKEFLRYAYYFWTPPIPTYVLLVGDATYDYKDYLGIGLEGHLPTHFFENSWGSYQTSNDNWFVCVSGDDVLPDMSIGRLPVKNSSELENIIQKIFDYAHDYTLAGWKSTALMVADDSPLGEKFEQKSDALASLFPPSFQIEKAYLRDFPSGAQCRKEVQRLIDDGCLIINYTGHGAPDSWAREWLLQNEYVSYLSNRQKYPFIVMLTCLTSLFEHPTRDCLSEKLIKARNGAIGTWAATGLIFVGEYPKIGFPLYRAIFGNENFTFGSFTTQAKLDYLARDGVPDHAEMYTLFGDPALKLNVINPEAPLVEWRIANGTLTQEGQFVPPNPLFVAMIRSKHAIIPESIEITLDGQNISLPDPTITYLPSSRTLAEIQMQTDLKEGSHQLGIVVSDSAGLKGEDRIRFLIQESKLSITRVMNYPNPMRNETYFTYELSQPAEVTIKIFTLSGRLIQVLNDYSTVLFNTIEWDGRDKDGDNIANGVYLYKVIAKTANQSREAIEKLAKIE